MKKRFESELEFRLDRICDEGAAVISTLEIYRWFERERITRSVWEDIDHRWKEREEDSTLFVGQNDHSYTLIWGAGLTADKDAYFRPISEMAGAA